MSGMENTESVPEIAAPRRVIAGRYELIDLIGAGGMAEVWRASDRRLGRDVAVKLLPGASARDASRRRRIEREARALATLNHPNVVAVYDYGEEEDPGGGVLPYVVMEFGQGSDLHRYLETRGRLENAEARELLRGILSGLAAAHAAGIVHGDLKPANVLVCTDGPKVGDFGVARILAEETGTTTVAATPTFAAPEVLKGERPTVASDVYSAACVAFQVLTGRAPYEGSNAWEVASKHIEEPVPKLRNFRSDVPSELEEAIGRGMAKDPKLRYASAEAFSRAIDENPATMPVTPDPVSSASRDRTEVLPERPDLVRVALLGPLAGWWERMRARGRHPVARGLLVLLGVLIAVFLFALAMDRGPEPVAVPDVRGLNTGDAAAELRAVGLRADVSYRPVTEGEAGVVLETIPATGERVRPGSEVHLVASAFERTPEPVRVTVNNGRVRVDHDNDRGKDRGKDRDD